MIIHQIFPDKSPFSPQVETFLTLLLPTLNVFWPVLAFGHHSAPVQKRRSMIVFSPETGPEPCPFHTPEGK
jgi:hypothetical protein